MNELHVRALERGDRERWAELYAAYAAFYRVEQTEAMRERVWGWLHGPAREVSGLVAEADGRIVGIAHLRDFVRPLAAETGLYLDDLYVDPIARGSGAGGALLEAARALAADRGHTVVRWITARDNVTARRLYDRTAEATEWVTYDMAV